MVSRDPPRGSARGVGYADLPSDLPDPPGGASYAIMTSPRATAEDAAPLLPARDGPCHARAMRRLDMRRPAACATLLTLAACAGPEPSAGPDGSVVSDAATGADALPPGIDAPITTSDGWADVAPIFERRCVPCHREGEIGGFGLDSYDAIAPLAPLVAAMVETRRMPPFPPAQRGSGAGGGDDCPTIDDFRNMPDAERARVVAWARAGAPRGTGGPDRLTHAGGGPLGPPDHTYPMPVAYTPPPATSATDDYRCFVIDPGVTTPLPLAAMSIQPGNRAIVHHAVAFMVAPAQASQARALDDGEAGPGYTCYGGAMVSPAYTAGLWVPGDASVLEPPRDDVGYWFPAGWQLVLQVHYNVERGNGGDRSSIVMWETPGAIGEVPRNLLLGDYDFVIPPRAPRVEGTASGWFTAPGTTDVPGVSAAEGVIYAVTPHMHQLGASFRMQLVHADGTSECVLRIPAWDFHWQGIYRLPEGVRARAGDELRVTCEWRNETGDDYVTYGEESSDEMCFGSVAIWSGGS